MKSSYIIFALWISLFQNCSSQQNMHTRESLSTPQKISKIEKIQVQEQTRGTNRIFTFTSGSINTSLNGTVTQKALSSDDWENISKQAASINLSEMSDYTAPTTGRYSDSALSSTIIITSAGKTYESDFFDAGIPPKELEGLYQLLKGKSEIAKQR